jgi:hypothetical protein
VPRGHQRFWQIGELLRRVVEMLIQTLPDLFGAVGGFVPLLEDVRKSGKVKIINKHGLILLHATHWEPTYKIFRLKSYEFDEKEIGWRLTTKSQGHEVPKIPLRL